MRGNIPDLWNFTEEISQENSVRENVWWGLLEQKFSAWKIFTVMSRVTIWISTQDDKFLHLAIVVVI